MSTGRASWEVWRRKRRMRIIGHRGASALVTENTLEAFARALDDGADGVELDVRLCASGEVVVFHDDDLQRLAGRGETIESLPLEAVRAVKLRGGLGIPTLADVLEKLPPAPINVEIKSAAAGSALRLTERAIEVIRRCDAADRVLFSSFDPAAVLQARIRAPEIPAAMLVHAAMRRPLREAWGALAIRPFAIHPENTLVTAARMRRWRRSELAVNVWTVDARAELRRLDALGVDGVFANDPRAAREALAI